MIEVEIPLAENISTPAIAAAVKAACSAHGLILSMEGSLEKYPGSWHWHFKRESESGTLEFTHWPGKRGLWATVQARRKAEWIEAMLPLIKRSILESLKS